MKKSLKFLLAACLFINVAALTSCAKEVCENCSAEVVVYQNGSEVSRSSVSAIEYCDEDLEQLKESSPIETNQMVGSMTQRSVTTYTCN